MIFGLGYSRANTLASAHDLIECPDGKASPPLKKPTLSPLISGRGRWVPSFSTFTAISESINASIPIRPVSRARGLSPALPTR